MLEKFKKSLASAGGKAFEIDRDEIAFKIKELFAMRVIVF